MPRPSSELILRNEKPPAETHEENDLRWFCRCFGLHEPRDRGETGIRVLRALLQAARDSRGIRARDLAGQISVSPSLAVYYLNKLIARGLVHRAGTAYELRRDSAEGLVDELEQDARRTFASIRGIAREIDAQLGLRTR